MSEYDMNEFIDFLSEMSEKNGEDEDDIAYENRYKQLAIRLGDQHNTYMLNSFLHYLGSGTSKGLANEINKIAGIDDDKAMRCVETLIMLYPMSGAILTNIDEKLFQGISWEKVLYTIQGFTNKFGNFIDQNDSVFCGYKDQLKKVEEEIKKNKEKIEVKKKEKELYEAKRAENNDLLNEISTLEKDIEWLKSNSQEDQLIKKKEELEKKKSDWERKNKSVAEELKKVEEEFSDGSSPHSAEFEKSLEAFREVMSKLPEDLTKRDGR